MRAAQDVEAGLIGPLRPARLSGGRRALAVAVCGGFLLLIGGRLVADALFPAEVLVALGNEQIEHEREARAARFRDGTLMRWIEKNVRLRSRVQRWAGPWYAWALYRTLGEIHASVIAGRDGWLFKKDRVLPLSGSAERIADRSRGLIAALNRRVRSFGIETIAALVPRKADVYEEMLPHGLDARPALHGTLAGELERTGVRAPDLLRALREHREEDLWHRADTHWNHRAMVVAAEEIARAAGRLVPAEARHTRLVRLGAGFERADLYRLAGLPFLPGPEPRTADRVQERFEVQGNDGQPLTYIWGDDPRPADVIITGTSFTALQPLPFLLWHFMDTPVRADAWPALGPGEPIRRSFQGILARGRLPKLMIWEIPAYTVLCHDGALEPLAQALAEIPAPAATPLAEWHPALAGVLSPRPVDVRRGRIEIGPTPVRLPIRKGLVWHQGDGSLSLRIRGRVEGPPVSVRVASEGRALEAVWEAGREEIVLPIVGRWSESSASPSLRVPAGASAVEIENVELVTDLDAGAAAAAAAGPVEAASGGWKQVLAFARPPDAARCAAAVFIFSAASGRFEGGEVTLEVMTAARDTPRLSVTAAGLGRPGVAIVGLSAIAGERVVSLAVRGQGTPPDAGASAGLVAPLKVVR